MNSRDKGKRGELEFAKVLEEIFPSIEATRNLDQCRGGGCDLVITPKVSAEPDGGPIAYHLSKMRFEIKRRANISESETVQFWQQAYDQSIGVDGAIPVLAYRANNRPWRIRIPLSYAANQAAPTITGMPPIWAEVSIIGLSALVTKQAMGVEYF